MAGCRRWCSTSAFPGGGLRRRLLVPLDEIVVEAVAVPTRRCWPSGSWSTRPSTGGTRSTSRATGRGSAERLDHALARCGVAAPHAGSSTTSRSCGSLHGCSRRSPTCPPLAGLRDQGLVVGLCSNWDWDLDRHLDHNGITGLLDFVVCSASAGYRKPHPAIFEGGGSRPRAGRRDPVRGGQLGRRRGGGRRRPGPRQHRPVGPLRTGRPGGRALRPRPRRPGPPARAESAAAG